MTINAQQIKEELREELRKDMLGELHYIRVTHEQQTRIRTSIIEIKEDIVAQKSINANILARVEEINDKQDKTQEEILSLKEEITGVKEEVTSLKGEITDVKEEITSVKGEVTSLHEKIDLILKHLKTE